MFTLLAFTEIRRSSVRDTFIALVMNSLWDWEPRERLNSIEDFLFQDDQHNCECNEGMDTGSRQTRKDRSAVVEA